MDKGMVMYFSHALIYVALALLFLVTVALHYVVWKRVYLPWWQKEGKKAFRSVGAKSTLVKTCVSWILGIALILLLGYGMYDAVSWVVVSVGGSTLGALFLFVWFAPPLYVNFNLWWLNHRHARLKSR